MCVVSSSMQRFDAVKALPIAEESTAEHVRQFCGLVQIALVQSVFVVPASTLEAVLAFCSSVQCPIYPRMSPWSSPGLM